MRFTMIGDIYCAGNEARRYRRMVRLGELPEGVTVTIGTHNDFDRELVRHYPFVIAVRAYDVSREAFEAAQTEFALYPTDTQTGGILGGDGDIGWTPAMCWENEADAYNGSFGSIYVTPWPETVRPITRPHSWERIANAIYRHYR